MPSGKKRIAIPGLVLLALLFITLVAYGLSEFLVWPEADGTQVQTNKSLTVDFSHADQGYIMVCAEKSDKRYKARVKMGKATLTYDLNSNGEYEIFPLQLGSGKYSVSLYKNASGSKYSDAGSVNINVQLADPNAPFLCPNQFVNYTEDSRAVALSEEICGSLSTDTEKFEAVRNYIVSNFTYDFAKAATVTSGTLPSADYVLDNRMGICQDLSALTACMLRVQGIPVKFMIGYCGKQYHAWNLVTIDGQEILYDPTMELGGVSGKKYSVERFY